MFVPKKIWTHKFFWIEILWMQHFFELKIFFGPNIFWTQNILESKFFWTQILFTLIFRGENISGYQVTHKKVYLFLRILYPNYVITKLKEFYIDKHVFMNTAWICLRFVCKQSLKRVIYICAATARIYI